MRRLLVAAILLSSTALASTGLSGTWSGSFDITISGETRPDTAYMVLKETGGTVEGTAGPNSDKQWQIKNGKLDGSKLTFEVDADGGLLTFELTFDGETIKGTASGKSPDGTELVARIDLKQEK